MAYKEIPGPIEGYKIFNRDMTCRDFQFELGMNALGNDKPLSLCGNGFHFCKYPSGVWAYYQEGRVFRVRGYDVLDEPITPGADHKMCCRKIEILEEVLPVGNWNTGNWNAGNGNTGNWNAGNENTGNRNSGDGNAGDRNTGYGNTGNRNTGDGNAGDRNTGYGNTGNGNAGDRNTGNWNAGDNHSGYFGIGVAPTMFFGKPVKEGQFIDWELVSELCAALSSDATFDPAPYLALPNATKAYIKRLHKAHIEGRKKASGK